MQMRQADVMIAGALASQASSLSVKRNRATALWNHGHSSTTSAVGIRRQTPSDARSTKQHDNQHYEILNMQYTRTITITDFQATQLVRALQKRAQVLRQVPRRNGQEPEAFEKLVAVEGLIVSIRAAKRTPIEEPDFECERCAEFFPESEAVTITQQDIISPGPYCEECSRIILEPELAP